MLHFSLSMMFGECININFDRGHPVVLILTVSLHIVQLSKTAYKIY